MKMLFLNGQWHFIDDKTALSAGVFKHQQNSEQKKKEKKRQAEGIRRGKRKIWLMKMTLMHFAKRWELL